MSDAWDGPQRGEGDSAGDSEACDGLQGGGEAWGGPREGSTGSTGLQEGCDGPQREQDEPIGNPTGDPTGDPMGDPMGGSTGDSTPIDQYCSSCTQKSLL